MSPPLDAPHRRVRFQRRRINADRFFPGPAPRPTTRSRTHVNTASCVSTSISRRVRDTGVAGLVDVVLIDNAEPVCDEVALLKRYYSRMPFFRFYLRG